MITLLAVHPGAEAEQRLKTPDHTADQDFRKRKTSTNSGTALKKPKTHDDNALASSSWKGKGNEAVVCDVGSSDDDADVTLIENKNG